MVKIVKKAGMILDIVKIDKSGTRQIAHKTNLTRAKYLSYLTLDNWKPQEAAKYFESLCGLKLHLPSKYGTAEIKDFYSYLLSGFTTKKPKDVQHVLIAHGFGSSLDGTWTIAGTNHKVFDYINKNIPRGQNVLVTCCETSNKTNGKIGVGENVWSINNANNPYKIIESGKNEIVGYYYGGNTRYYDAPGVKIIKK